jgi:hypothetical protein
VIYVSRIPALSLEERLKLHENCEGHEHGEQYIEITDHEEEKED